MDRFDRIFRLHTLLSSRKYHVSLEDIMEQLECSKSTVERDIRDLRDYLNAPLEYSREHQGYIYNQKDSATPFELPGLWFSTEELHGLLITQHILASLSPGILSEQIAGLQRRIDVMLNQRQQATPVIAEKIQIASIGRRMQDDSQFKRIATALFNGKQIHIEYHPRGSTNGSSHRIISAQKLLYYRNNWYIVAYCHQRNALRTFAIDRIRQARQHIKEAVIVKQQELDKHINASYGIFSGQAKHQAVLQFSARRANWIADEHWHPQQQGHRLENDDYQLSIPFNDSRELVMDILKHGSEVTVISPEFLKTAVMEEINKMQKNYHTLTK